MAIISHWHKFIFIKTTKTAGTTIEVELAKRIEARSIVTRVIPPMPGHEPRNWRRGFLRTPFYNHMPATLIRKFIGRESFEGMYRFCVEREPVSKCISHFHMLKNSPDHGGRKSADLSWDAYCTGGDFPIDIDKYSEVVNGKRILLVDRVITYETLEQSLKQVMKHIGIMPFELTAQAKADYSATRHVSKEDVTPTQRATIYAAFAPSIAVAGLGDVYVL